MFTQITKGLSESIDKALAKHAPAQNLGQNLSHKNITKPAQNLASQSLAPQVQTQTNTRQALTRFGNELAQNPQTKPTQAVFDFDFIARDKTSELPKQSTQISPSRAQADTGGGLFDLPSQAQKANPPQNQTAQDLAQNSKDEALQNLQHAPAQSHTTQAQNLAPHTPQSQSLQARYDTLHDFANKMSERKESLSHEAKSLYDSFAKSLDSLSPESLSAKELNATDRHLSEYLVRTELAQIPSAKDIVLPYFSAKYQAKNEAELAQTFGSEKLAQMRQALQESKNTNPLSEFGTNYAEFYQDGKGAIAKLIAEANAAKQAGKDFNGQVAGAFSKEIDGAEASIDLVWGKITNAQTHEGYGLAHIIDKHPEITPQMLDEIIAQGKVESKNGVYTITLQKDGKDYRVGLSKGWNGKGDNEWIITAYQNNKGSAETSYHDTFTTKEPLENLDNEIIQKSAQKIQEKMKVSKEYAENLAKWHKDSHPITKEADGTPKVFYHATNADKKFEIFDKSKIHSGYGFWFGDDIKSQAVQEAKTSNIPIYKVFLKMKKPFEVLEPINKNNYKEFEKIFDKNFEKELKNNEKIAEFESFVKQELNVDEVDIGVVNFMWSVRKDGKWKDYCGNELNKILTPKIEKEAQKYLDDGIIRKIYFNHLPRAYAGGTQEVKQIKQRLINNGYDGIKYGDEYVVFDSNQIKAVGNKGTFEATNPNIYHSSSTAGGGVLGGTIAGVERDEEGNIIGFSPEKFALGFASGAAGAKALSKIANTKPVQNLANSITQNRASQNLTNSKITQNLANSKTLQMLVKKARTNPRAKAVLDKIKSKNDIIASQKQKPQGQKQMAEKQVKSNFEVTKELEKQYRNAIVTPKQEVVKGLDLKGRVVGDFVKLAQKHPEYFAHPQEAQKLCQEVLKNAEIGINATDRRFKLIIAKVKNGKRDYGSVAIRVQNINGEHRIRSVLFMDSEQIRVKIAKAKELGEPILQF